jgi:ferric reductase like protein
MPRDSHAHIKFLGANTMASVKYFSSAKRLTLGSILVILAMLLLVAGWTVPYLFESSSILYKFGIQKVLLRSGKVVGITVTLLLFYQVLLASRFKLLERIFSHKGLLATHRANGFLIALLVLMHPLLIKASENFTAYMFERKYYPEFVGIGLLFIILTVSMLAFFKERIGFSYGKWLLLHRLGATMVLFILPLHVLWVSDTFKEGLPRNAALGIFGLNLLLLLRIWLRRLLS